MTDPELAHLRRVAQVMSQQPLPVVDGQVTYHFGGPCPCPKCYSLRAASWERRGQPYPKPPEREAWAHVLDQIEESS